MSAYNETMITKLIAEALDGAGHGSAANLARTCEVNDQTVSKWRKGDVTPLPWRWPVIEKALGIEEGTLARESGYTGPLPSVLDPEIIEWMRAIDERLSRIEDRIGE